MRRRSTSSSTLVIMYGATTALMVATMTSTQAFTMSTRYSIPIGGAQSPMA